MESIDFEAEVSIIDPKTEEHIESRQRYAKAFWETQKRRGKTLYECDSPAKRTKLLRRHDGESWRCRHHAFPVFQENTPQWLNPFWRSWAKPEAWIG